MTASSDPMILVPLDGSSLAEQALPVATDLAQRFGARIHLLVVVDGAVEHNVGEGAEDDHALAGAVDEYLAGLAADHRVGDVVIDWSTPFSTTAAEVITTTADELGADLVVIASHGRSGFSRLLAGSVAEQVIRSSKVPVVAVPTSRDE